MDNMNMLQGYLMDENGAMRRVEGQQHMPNVVPKQRRHAVRFWTIEEHRYFIFALIWKARVFVVCLFGDGEPR